ALRDRPQDYWTASAESAGDQYFTVYAEGMRPNHAMETGFSLSARRDAMRAATELLSECLVPGQALPQDPHTFNITLPITLLDADEVESRSHGRKPADVSKEQHQENNLAETQRIKLEATRRSLGLGENRAVQVLICYSRDETRLMLRQKL